MERAQRSPVPSLPLCTGWLRGLYKKHVGAMSLGHRWWAGESWIHKWELLICLPAPGATPPAWHQLNRTAVLLHVSCLGPRAALSLFLIQLYLPAQDLQLGQLAEEADFSGPFCESFIASQKYKHSSFSTSVAQLSDTTPYWPST